MRREHKKVAYSYDAAGRLTPVQHPSGITESYTYDSAGNRMVQANSAAGTVGGSKTQEDGNIQRIL